MLLSVECWQKDGICSDYDEWISLLMDEFKSLFFCVCCKSHWHFSRHIYIFAVIHSLSLPVSLFHFTWWQSFRPEIHKYNSFSFLPQKKTIESVISALLHFYLGRTCTVGTVTVTVNKYNLKSFSECILIWNRLSKK